MIYGKSATSIEVVVQNFGAFFIIGHQSDSVKEQGNTVITELQELAESAKEYAENSQERNYELDGACHENVIGICEFLTMETNLEPHITWGYLSNGTSLPNTVSESEKTGRVHFWAEINLEGCDKWIIMDIFALPTQNSPSSFERGSVIVTEGTPPDYHRPEKSRFKYESWMEPGHLLSLSDYELIRPRVSFSN